MDEKMIQKKIKAGREFMKYHQQDEFGDFVSDQNLKKPQPPLVKGRMREDCLVLPRDFETLKIEENLTNVMSQRRSSRVFTEEKLSLIQLSYLLWATQGVKELRGKSYATLRTVPSGGARHGFETYLMVQNVEGLIPGKYHYLPMEHALEFLGEESEIKDKIDASLMGQSWANKASVVFYWSVVPYRCEWRYGIFAHRVALIDVGHVGENLYIACSGLGLGVCGIAAFDDEICNPLFELEGQEEFMVYTAPVGTISQEDREKEKGFYKFVEEQGL